MPRCRSVTLPNRYGWFAAELPLSGQYGLERAHSNLHTRANQEASVPGDYDRHAAELPLSRQYGLERALPPMRTRNN
jgi:hypothetical protein